MITKDENKAVKEVRVVLEVLKEYVESKKDVPYAVLDEVFKKLLAVEEDYDKTIRDLLASNSLVVKYEKLLELIGIVSTISVEDEPEMDNILMSLEKYNKIH